MSLGTTQSRSVVSEVFGDLPDALINELLVRAEGITEQASLNVDARVAERDKLRERALKLGLISELGDLSELPPKSVVAVDGSVAVVRLASFELAAAAALAVEGIGWDSNEAQLPYEFEVLITDPVSYANEVAYGLMFCMEYEVAAKADRDLVMLDGAFSTGMVAISLALRAAAELRDDLSEAFKARWFDSVMGLVPKILGSSKIVALPKRTSSNEFVTQTRLFESQEIDANGRSTASLILKAGEYSGPFRLETHGFLLARDNISRKYMSDLSMMYSDIGVVYYKPADWTHAFRIELPSSIASDTDRLHETLEVVLRQTVNPAIMEPYPLYVADRFAKSLGKGVDALLDSTRTRVIANSLQPRVAADMLNAYRTDPSFEGDMS